MTATIDAIHIVPTLCYVKSGILFPAGNTFLDILNGWYRSTMSCIHKMEIAFNWIHLVPLLLIEFYRAKENWSLLQSTSNQSKQTKGMQRWVELSICFLKSSHICKGKFTLLQGLSKMKFLKSQSNIFMHFHDFMSTFEGVKIGTYYYWLYSFSQAISLSTWLLMCYFP